MKDNINVQDFFNLLLNENYSSLDDYFNSINLDKEELSKFRSKKKSKKQINQHEEEELINNKETSKDSLRKEKTKNDSEIGREDSPRSGESVAPDFSEEEKKDYSKVDLKEANVFREVVKLIGRMRAGYSIEEEEIEEKFKFYFTQLTLTERETLYLFLKAFVIMIDPEINDASSEEDEESDSVEGDDSIDKKIRLPLPKDHGINIERKKDKNDNKAKSLDTEEKENKEVSRSSKTSPESENINKNSKEEKNIKKKDEKPKQSVIVVGESKQNKKEIINYLKENLI